MTAESHSEPLADHFSEAERATSLPSAEDSVQSESEQRGSKSVPDIEASQLLSTLQKYWGYNSFRPLQLEAMQAVLKKQDSLVVLPTGGGKSLCYQVPALLRDGLAIIVSPLIALMKDQVDALKECGINAAAVNSSLSSDERWQIANQVRDGQIKILYVAPERLCTERMLQFLGDQKISFLAVDEAHCISSWGHNFRPEYRILGQLREHFSDLDIHAYTATATEHVREDIAKQLKLKTPDVLVGNFDRPNLTYRISRRDNLLKQVREVIDRHPDESGIIYCITRKQVENLSADLDQCGYRAVAYHAGMEHDQREKSQNDFLNEKTDIVVATVAFGMGIDKSNVRYVIHASATKSLENYQQETGRAGRDGLPAECCLFYGGNDFFTWKTILSDLQGEAAKVAADQLAIINSYCVSATCRHRALVEHFGQSYSGENCKACDTCLGELKEVAGAFVISQKILSCVYRVEERFGAEYIASVLTGSKEQRLLDNNHDQLSTYGLLRENTKRSIKDWIEQLIGQGCLERYGDYGTLRLTPGGQKVFKNEFTPKLLKPTKATKSGRSSRKSSAPKRGELSDAESLLFEELRRLRREIAEEKGVPPFVVFGDVTLIDLAKKKPRSEPAFLNIHGVGGHKCEEYGERFMQQIKEFCEANEVKIEPANSIGVASGAESESTKPLSFIEGDDAPPELSNSARQAAVHFKKGMSVEEVAAEMGRALSTTSGYLSEYMTHFQITSPEPWLDTETFQKITKAACMIDSDRLKPLFESLNEEVPYEELRIAVACLKNLDLKN